MSEEKPSKPPVPSGLGADSDLPAVLAYLDSDHHEAKGYSQGELQRIRGAVQGFIGRVLDGENSDITQLFTQALFGSLLRTANQNVTDRQAKRKADAMLRATGLAGRSVVMPLNGRLSGTMYEHMHEVMVGEAFEVSQGQVIREIVARGAIVRGGDVADQTEELNDDLTRELRRQRGK